MEPTPIYEEYPDMRYHDQLEQQEYEAYQNEYRLKAEKESNEAIKALKAKHGKDYFAPSYDDQEFAFRNSNAFNY